MPSLRAQWTAKRKDELMAKSITYVLPPRHGGYRPAASDAKNTPKRGYLPKPPSGEGGGSKQVSSGSTNEKVRTK